jgi:hypothetical protein
MWKSCAMQIDGQITLTMHSRTGKQTIEQVRTKSSTYGKYVIKFPNVTNPMHILNLRGPAFYFWIA